ncbi:MAG: UDP-N-acetylglucosamine pyrophosphorylase [Lachnospiraceae bacterium]|nr:UDP-N-acetylglucosamine pyrophosphorylase [Lachnospiraceae bacterium]
MHKSTYNIVKSRLFECIPEKLKPWFPTDKPIWHILDFIPDAIIKIYEANKDQYAEIGKNIYVDKTAMISKYTEIKGPALIGKNCEIRHGAFLRENVIIGDNCVIGNSTEIKNSVLFNNVEVSHFNYVGDSILGNNVHFGAGVIISNVLLIKNKTEKNKKDYKEVKIKMPDGTWIETNRKKFGAIIGDFAEIGVNTTINPGTCLEMNIFVPSSVSIGGYFKAGFVFPKNIIYGADE